MLSAAEASRGVSRPARAQIDLESASRKVSDETRALSTRAPRPLVADAARAKAPEKQGQNGESPDGVTVEALW